MKKLFLLFLCVILVFSITLIPVSASTESEDDIFEFSGHYYKVFNTPMTWDEAKLYCFSRGGHLATISSSGENDFIQSILKGESAYIGAYKTPSTGFQWVDGSPTNYRKWDSGQPDDYQGNQDVVHMYTWGKWDDMAGYQKKHFVCEWESLGDIDKNPAYSGVSDYNGHKYKRFDMTLSWEDANLYCVYLGGHLATVSSSEENDFIHSLLGATSCWIGASDINNEGLFGWVGGDSLSYENWSEGEPNNTDGIQDCVQMYPDSGKWDDEYGHSHKSFICEWDTDGTVPINHFETDLLSFGGHRYKIFTSELSWEDAAAICSIIGGHLVTLSDWDEFLFISRTSAPLYKIWTGYTDREYEGNFVGVNGEALMIKDQFEYAEPNDSDGKQDYLSLSYLEKFEDAYNFLNYAFVCEFEFECINNGIGFEKHDFPTYYKTELDPTCTNTGIKSTICKRCGYENKVEISALGHDSDTPHTVIPSTCTQNGEEISTCKTCGEDIHVALPKSAHSYTKWTASKRDSCGDTVQEESRCDDCGEYTTRSLMGLSNTNIAVILTALTGIIFMASFIISKRYR